MDRKGGVMRWLKVIFLPSMDEKEHPDVRRLYVKGDCLNVELPDVDAEGRPKIVSYPLCNIFSFSRPHMAHDGAGARKGG